MLGPGSSGTYAEKRRYNKIIILFLPPRVRSVFFKRYSAAIVTVCLCIYNIYIADTGHEKCNALGARKPFPDKLNEIKFRCPEYIYIYRRETYRIGGEAKKTYFCLIFYYDPKEL